MRKYSLALGIGVATIVFIFLGFALGDKLRVSYMASGSDIRFTAAAGTPAAAVESLFANIQRRQFDAAYNFLANRSEVDKRAFVEELNGSDGSLRSYSVIQDFEAHQLNREGDTAKVRTNLRWSTAVGAFYESRDFDVLRTKDGWKVQWQTAEQPSVPPQVVPVSYPRWDVFQPGATRVDVNERLPSPKVRITSQNAIQDADTFAVIGEVANEDTVPAFIAITAEATDKSGKSLGTESSFESVRHVLLPGERSPFRINYAGVNRDRVGKVSLRIASTLVSASADPIIEVSNVAVQDADANTKMLTGHLLSKSGQVVNIPHLIAAAYDASGKVVWVQDTYLNRALLPQTAIAFGMKVPPETAQIAKDFRFAVNSYRIEQ
jgi:hypothetical protein